MLPALAGFATKALLPSGKKIDKDKLLNKKESSAIQKVDGEKVNVKTPTIKKKIISTNLLLPQPEIKEPPSTSEVKKSEGNFKDIFSRINKTLNGIIESLKNRETNTKEEEKTKKKEADIEKRKDREDELEKGERKKTPKFSLKAPQDKFNIMRFFGNVLLGALVLAIFNNIEQIIETLKNVFQTIKDFLTKLGEFFSPLWNGFKWIVGEGTKLVGQLLGIPKEDLDDKDILKNLNEIKDKIPGLKQLFEGINNTIESLRSGRGLNPSPQPDGGAGGGGGGGGGAVPLAGGAKAGAYDIASRIGANKQQWDTFRNTIAQIESGGSYTKYGGSGNHYDGRYQMGAAAKQDAARILGIPYPGHSDNPNDPKRIAFRSNPELQERMFAAYTLANHGYLSSDVNYQAKQTVEQKLQVLGYAHNQGAGGASKWMRTGKVGKDGFGTAGTKYSNALRSAFKGSSTPSAAAATPMPSPSPAVSTPSRTPTPAASAPAQVAASAAAPAQVAASQETSVAQISPSQPSPPVAASVPQIMQQTDYEISYQEPKSTILPIPIAGQTGATSNMSGKSTILPFGMSKKQALNSYYQAQLIGFLYKQG